MEVEIPTFEFGTNVGQLFVYPLNFRLFTFTWKQIKSIVTTQMRMVISYMTPQYSTYKCNNLVITANSQNFSAKFVHEKNNKNSVENT